MRFDPAMDLRFHRDQMYPDADVVTHPNGMRFTALDEDGGVVFDAGVLLGWRRVHSVGGGVRGERAAAKQRVVPYPFRSAAELLRAGERARLTIAEIVLANEFALLADRDDCAAHRPDCGRSGRIWPRWHLEELTPEQQVSAAMLTLWQSDAGLHCARDGDGRHAAGRVECAAARAGVGAAVGAA